MTKKAKLAQDRAAGGLLARLATLPPGTWYEVWAGNEIPADLNHACHEARALGLVLLVVAPGDMYEDGKQRFMALRISTKPKVN